MKIYYTQKKDHICDYPKKETIDFLLSYSKSLMFLQNTKYDNIEFIKN